MRCRREATASPAWLVSPWTVGADGGDVHRPPESPAVQPVGVTAVDETSRTRDATGGGQPALQRDASTHPAVECADGALVRDVAILLAGQLGAQAVTLEGRAIAIAAGPQHAAGELRLQTHSWLLTFVPVSPGESLERRRSLGRASVTPGRLATHVATSLVTAAAPRSPVTPVTAKPAAVTPVAAKRSAAPPNLRRAPRPRVPPARVSGLQEMDLVRSFARFVDEVETSTGSDDVQDFHDCRPAVTLGLTPSDVRVIVGAHPEMVAELAGEWTTQRRGRRTWATHYRRTAAIVGVSDSPVVRASADDVHSMSARDAAWHHLAVDLARDLTSERTSAVRVTLWSPDHTRPLLVIPVSLILDEEPAWVAAVHVDTQRDKRLYRASRSAGWSMWAHPEAHRLTREPAAAARPRRPVGADVPWADWTDERRLASAPLTWDRVIATYRRPEAAQVTRAIISLVADHLGVDDPGRVGVDVEPLPHDELLRRRRARAETRALFPYWSRPKDRSRTVSNRAPITWCRVCGQGLTDPDSVRDGMGPICAGRAARWSPSGTMLSATQRQQMLTWSHVEPELWAEATSAEVWARQVLDLL